MPVSWPSTLPLPSHSFGFDVEGRALFGNGNRVFNETRTRDGETVFTFNAQWDFLDSEFQTFKAFFETDLYDGAIPFEITLPSGDYLQTHEVFFMGGQFAPTVRHGLIQSVSAQLVCHNPPVLSEALLDELLVLSPDDFDFVDYIDPLNQLVETTLTALLP